MNEKLYFPLTAEFQNDPYDDEEACEASDVTIIRYLDEINSELTVYQNMDGSTMLDFFDEDDNISKKMTSMKWGVCAIEDKPFGFVEIELTEPLTEDELKKLKDWIEGQNSDGLGEGFEQRAIETDYGDMYVSMWQWDGDYEIKTQSEMDEMFNQYSISTIDAQDLRHMKGQEGLVVQGCGGDLNQWIEGINGELSDRGILKDGTKFRNVYSFKSENLTNLVFPFDEKVKLDMGKFAIWRLSTHEQFGGTWLSDYVDNHLGGYLDEKPAEKIKPDCALIGEDGNIFNLMGIASRTLRENGMADEAKEMCDRITHSDSYYSALNIIGEYVNITSTDEDMDDDYDEGIDMC